MVDLPHVDLIVFVVRSQPFDPGRNPREHADLALAGQSWGWSYQVSALTHVPETVAPVLIMRG
jgi:hypothetical protein